MIVIYTKHAKQRMKERKIKKTIVSSMVKKQNKVTFENDSKIIFQDGSIKVVAYKKEDKIIIVTIIRKKSKKILDKRNRICYNII